MSNFDLGDFLSLIIVFAVYLTAASGKKKKGKQKRRPPMRSRAQGEQRDSRAKARDAQTLEGFGDAFVQASGVSEKAQQRCDTRKMHLHEVSQQQLASAGEGEDPCHVGDAQALHADGGDGQDNGAFELIQTDDSGALAQNVLRGVIMSEILTRPQERAALRRGRR